MQDVATPRTAERDTEITVYGCPEIVPCALLVLVEIVVVNDETGFVGKVVFADQLHIFRFVACESGCPRP